MLKHKNAAGFYPLNGVDDAFDVMPDLSATGTAVGTGTGSPFFGANYDLDGTDDHSSFTSSAITDLWDGGGTVAFWAKTTNTGATLRVIGKSWDATPSSGWVIEFLYVDASNVNLQLARNGASGKVTRWYSGNLTHGVWRHFCLTYNDDSLTNDPLLYVNGVLTSTTEFSSSPASFLVDSTQVAWIGESFAGTYDYLGGISSLYFHTSILSAQDIRRLYMGLHPIGAL